MQNWSFDIDRQSAWDWWCWVCLAAAAVLVVHWCLRPRQDRAQPLAILLSWAPVTLTIFILALPPLRQPVVGLVWTIVMLLAATLSQYLNLRIRLTPVRIAILLSLRTLALLLAVPMLFEPVLRFTSRKDPERPLVLLVDGSGSMSVPDVQNGPSRIQAVAQTLAQQWPAITTRFMPQISVFGATTAAEHPTPQTLNNQQADGQATDLVAAVTGALKTLPRDDAEIVLLSDGIDNVSPDAAAAIAASRHAIHTVLVGSDQAQAATVSNVAVDTIDAGDQWTVRSAARIEVTVHSSAMNGRLVDVNLSEIDEAGKPLATPLTQKLSLAPSPAGQQVSFDFTPLRTGIYRMKAWIDPIPGERSTADNQRIFQQLATDARIKVLYVEGRARPEYRELSRALARDGNVELATLLRVTTDRYAAGGGLDGKPIAALPSDAAGWRKFDVIILGDLPAVLLKPNQQQAIEQAVSEGSGLLMLGGQDSLGPGGYAGTPIEKALPVNVGGKDTTPDGGQDKTEFIPRLTDAGASHPTMTGLADWFGESPNEKLPTLLGNVTVDSAKPGADVLLNHGSAAKPIVLAVQRYGKGRSGVFTADTTYRWYLPMRGLGQQSPYTVFWGQLVRWLAGTDVKNRGTQAGVETLVDKTVLGVGEPVRVRAIVRDEKGDATRYAQVSMTLTPKDGKSDPTTLSLVPAAMRDGLYETAVTSLTKGDWTAEVVAKKDGKLLGRSPIAFSVIPPADEMFKLAADPALMQKIATATGGYTYRLSQLPQLIELLTRGGDQQLIQQRSVPLHNTARTLLAVIGVYPGWADRFDLPMQTIVIVALLVAEWALRRRWQLL